MGSTDENQGYRFGPGPVPGKEVSVGSCRRGWWSQVSVKAASGRGRRGGGKGTGGLVARAGRSWRPWERKQRTPTDSSGSAFCDRQMDAHLWDLWVCYLIWQKGHCKWDFVKDLEMGDYLALSRWIQSNRMGPYKWETGQPEMGKMWWWVLINQRQDREGEDVMMGPYKPEVDRKGKDVRMEADIEVM